MKPIHDQELFDEYASKRELKLKNLIAVKNQKLVTYVVNKFYNKKKEHKDLREDLLQEGRMGLLHAIDKFNPSYGNQFSTYAILWIKQSINNFLLNQFPLIHVPSNVKTMQNKVFRRLKEENLVLKDLIDGNAKSLDVTEKMLIAINASLRARWVSSIEEHVSNNGNGTSDNENTIKDLISNPDEVLMDVLTDQTKLLKVVKKSLNKLSDREKFILLLRYNVIDSVDKE